MEKNNSFIPVFVTKTLHLGYLWAICELYSPDWDILSPGLTRDSSGFPGAVTIISSLSQNLEVLHRSTCPLWQVVPKFSETWKRSLERPWGQLTWQIKMGSTYRAIKSHHKAPSQLTSLPTSPPSHPSKNSTLNLIKWENCGWRPSNLFQVSEGIPVNTVL